MVGKVLLDEHPGTADFCARDAPRFGAMTQFLRVQSKEGCGIDES